MNRIIPRENYFKYAVVLLVSLISCYLLYTIYNNHAQKESLLRNKVKEIDVKDIDNYISENEEVLLYFGVVNDTNSDNIERNMIDTLDLENSKIVYVNITNLENKKDFLKEFSKKYSNVIEVTNYPAFVYIKNQSIIDYVQKDDRYLVMDDVTDLINKNEIKGEKDA